ncbi:MAG: hypothetical protein HY368_03300 [Candidatus Aenigmarchaeota archaeon]|nr:hypothetical protein [Candidatus Aenigmarchaeota archaeon]
MPEVVWVDDFYYPSEWTIRIRTRKPFQLVEMVPDLIRRMMKVTSKDVYEHDVRYDITVDPRTFYGFWEGRRQDDKWTRTTLRITVQGEQASTDAMGTAHVRFRGTVTTRYPYNNFIQRTFWWFYNRFFYYRQKRQYIFRIRDEVFQIKERMLKTFGVSEEEVAQGS